jgi:hypothetical protein
VRSSSTEQPSGGDADMGNISFECDTNMRPAGELALSTNLQSESVSTVVNKPRREKTTSKGQQDEEEERGNNYIHLLTIERTETIESEHIDLRKEEVKKNMNTMITIVMLLIERSIRFRCENNQP